MSRFLRICGNFPTRGRAQMPGAFQPDGIDSLFASDTFEGSVTVRTNAGRN